MKAPLVEYVKSIRLRYAFLTTLALLLIFDVAVRALNVQNKPNLTLRNEQRSDAYNDYFFRQMRLTDRPVIAFMGASIVQGFVNTRPENAMPMLIQEMLDEQGIANRCFNMALIGNNLGDHLALSSESIRNGADLVVIPLHFKLFSGRGTLNRMIMHKDNIFYLRGRKDFRKLRRKVFKITDDQWSDIKIRKNLELIWAFYRQRNLLSLWATGRTGPFPNALFMSLGRKIRFLQPLVKEPHDPKKWNTDNHWKKKSKLYHESNRSTYEDINLDFDNIHFQTLDMICAMGREKKAKLLFYLIPLNRSANEQFHYFDWEKHALFKQMTQEITEKYGYESMDLTDAVDNRHFTDGDHLNMRGHEEFAQALLPGVQKILAAKP